jgi:hypothetical protein
MVDEATVAVGSAEMVVLPAGLTSAGWKRVARGGSRLGRKSESESGFLGERGALEISQVGRASRVHPLSERRWHWLVLDVESNLDPAIQATPGTPAGDSLPSGELMWRHGLPSRRVWGGVRLLTNDPEWSVWWHCCGNLDCVKICDWVV